MHVSSHTADDSTNCWYNNCWFITDIKATVYLILTAQLPLAPFVFPHLCKSLLHIFLHFSFTASAYKTLQYLKLFVCLEGYFLIFLQDYIIAKLILINLYNAIAFYKTQKISFNIYYFSLQTPKSMMQHRTRAKWQPVLIFNFK